MITKHIINYLG